MVYFEAHSPPLPDEISAGVTSQSDAAIEALRREPGSLFGVLDASRGRRVLQLLRESVDEVRSLYDGVTGDALAGCAPHLVAFRADSGLLDRLVHEGWGQRWGVYLTSARPFKEVRRHLRRFLMVGDDETGKKQYFRFYDPGALRVFLPSCTPRQSADFFGEISTYLAEGEDGGLLRFVPLPFDCPGGAR